MMLRSCLLIAVLPVLVAAEAVAYTTLGDVFTEMAHEAAYSVYGDKEQDIIKDYLGFTIEYCEIRFPNRDGSPGTETHRRPGAFLCLKEYLNFILKNPNRALDVQLYAQVPNYPTVLPLKVTLKAPPMPEKKWTDHVNPFSDYPARVLKRLEMWRDLDITIESVFGPVPLFIFFPEKEAYDQLYTLLSKQDGHGKIYKIHLKAKTFLKEEIRSKPCLQLGPFDTHKSRVCFEAEIFSAPNTEPALTLLGVTNWNLRSQESRLKMDIKQEENQ